MTQKQGKLKKNSDHDHSNKDITKQELNTLAVDFAARLKQANLATKADIDHFVEKTNFNDKLII